MNTTNRPARAIIDNVAQAAAWNGPEGANWAAQSARRVSDGGLETELLAAAQIAPGERVLDIGCGTGDLTRRAARLAAGGRAVGVDLSALMIAQAREEAAQVRIDNVEFLTGDAQTYPFERAAFDVAVSHFGAMFFGDPVAAFANVADALRPGGRLAFVCPGPMERCDWYGIPLAALYGSRPTADEAPSAMFSLADVDTVSAVLVAAGLANVSIEPCDAALWFGRDVHTAAEGFLGSGPVRSFLERHPTWSDVEARSALTNALAPHVGDDGVRLFGAHWLVRATRPADTA